MGRGGAGRDSEAQGEGTLRVLKGGTVQRDSIVCHGYW